MVETKRPWRLVTGPSDNPMVLHAFMARGRLKAERKAYRRLLKRFGRLVAHGLMEVRLEQA